jgi:hypothetical protein
MSTSETATQQIPGLTRTDLQQHDLSALGRQVVQNPAATRPSSRPISSRKESRSPWRPSEGALMPEVTPSSGKLTVVLVHGAFADASSWNGVTTAEAAVDRPSVAADRGK